MTIDRDMLPTVRTPGTFDTTLDTLWRGVASLPHGFHWTHPGDLFLAQYFERDLIKALARHRFDELTNYRILDIGCDDGAFLRRLLVFGAHPHRMAGVDPVPEHIQGAQHVLAHLDARCGDVRSLTFEAASYDLVFQRAVLSSIPAHAERRVMANEMARMLKPGGIAVSYEVRGASGRAKIRPVRANELAALFPGFTLEARRVTLNPLLARALASRSWLLCELLETIPLLRTYELVLLRKPSC
jgi:SAM-dependent methyltransferase